MSYVSGAASTEAPRSSAGLIVVRRGEAEVFQTLAQSFETCVMWDRRFAERRVSHRPVPRDSREMERRSPPPVTWGAHGFLLASSQPGP